VIGRHFHDTPDLPEEARAFARALVNGVTAQMPQWDEQIALCAPAYPVDTLAAVDRNILRLALFELAQADVPVKVAVNEAVELAKMFGGEGAPRFVNGVLASAIMRYHSGRTAVE
jgi:N utilization substance protein B